MKIILRDDVRKLGKLGDVVEVREGYARNYLLPRQLAFPCTVDTERQIAAEKKRRASIDIKKAQELQKIAETLNGRSVTITAKAQEDRLYGSVGAPEIAEAIFSEHKIRIPESSVVLDEPFKTLGTPDVTIRLAEDAEAVVKVWIVADSD